MKFYNRLVFKIPLQILAVLFAVMVTLVIVLNVMLSGIIGQQTEEKVRYIAAENADMAKNYLDTMQTQSAALARSVQLYAGGDRYVTEQPLKDLLYLLLDDNRIYSAYIALEPDRFAPGTPDGLSYYAFRDGDSILLDVNNDYAVYNEGEYYAVTKSTLKPHITEPYSYELSTGEVKWLISISNPILGDDGTFYGVTNCDIVVDTLNSLDYDLGGFKTSYGYILSHGGAYVAHTADKDLMGTAYGKDDGQKNADRINGIIKGNKEDLFDGENGIFGGDAVIVHVPIQVYGIAESLSSAFVVTRSEAFEESNRVLLVVSGICLASLLVLGFILIFLMRRGFRPLNLILSTANDMKNGKLHITAQVKTKDEFSAIAAAFRETGAVLSGYVEDITHTVTAIANGNLDVETHGVYQGDFAPIKTALVNIIEKLNTAFSSIREASEQVRTSADQVSGGAQSLAQGSTEQASSVEQLSASITEVSDKVKSSAALIEAMAGDIREAEQNVNHSDTQMRMMTKAMEEIGTSSQNIRNIIKVIDDIAFQTNLLALNAAVEAARAGDAGRGFAVVAGEVRDLAARVAESARETTRLIENSNDQVERGSAIADETVASMTEVSQKMKAVSGSISKISESSEEQTVAIDQINKGIYQISSVIQMNSATAEESAAASEELAGQSGLLSEQVTRFKLKALQITKFN